MINQKVETDQGDFSDYAQSESEQGKENSVSSHPGIKGRLESMKKLKKVRSIRLGRFSSTRSSTSRRKSQYENLSMLSSDSTESSWRRDTPIQMFGASPSYMKATTSSHAKESFQITITHKLLTKKTLTRVSTLKLKRSLSRKPSERNEQKRKLKSSRKKISESVSNDQNMESTSDVKPYPTSITNKSQRVITRRLSLKPMRILSKVPTFKSQNSPIENSSLHRATCSSTLKDSHFHDHIDLTQEGSGSQGVSAVRVCPYTYCSLHGGRHGNAPPLKRFVSMRRRMLKTQKSMKMDGRPITRSKLSGNGKKNDEVVESTSTDVVKSSASDVDILEGEAATRGKTEQDYEEMRMSSAQEEAKLSRTTNVPYKMQEIDHKYIKMWHLVYKHAVSSNTGKEENKLPVDDGNNKEVRGQEAHSLNGVSKSFCQEMDDENNDVIQLLQKAFDEILLSEPEDLPSDHDFKSKATGSNEVHREKSEEKIGERITSTSIESPEEETRPKDGNFTNHEEEITAQRIPKSWSNLKRIILLKRFVNALEKVRKLNLQRPRHFPEDANFEAEKVFLKHQTTEEKKNAEDWMLDYALQKVISKLAPAQRRRVTLLVEAFETFLPFQDGENDLQSSTIVENQANPIQFLDDSSDHSREETDEGRHYYGYSAKTLFGKASSSQNNSIMEFSDNTRDIPMSKLHNPIFLDNPMPAYGTAKEDLKGEQSLASIYDNEKAPYNEIANEVPEDLRSNSDPENPNSESESTGRDFETKNLVGDNGEQFSKAKSLILNGLVRSFGSHMAGGSGATSCILDEPIEDRKGMSEKTTMDTRTLEGFPTHELSEAPMKQNYKGLWYLVYKHMKSDIAENNSESLLIDGTDEGESGHEGSRTRGTFVENSTPMMNEDMSFKDHGAEADQEVQLQQMEAIKMVEEAIDSILPDVQDNTISDNFKESNGTKNEGQNQNEEKMATKEQEEEEPVALKDGTKPNQQLPRSWSNLKKVILLRRFIKSLEKVREFNPRRPRYLPVEPDSEAEKVNLRHQGMAERKGTEEWMLDFALRQVVSKLTPARKRKVELLVEAFETVIPTIKS